MMQRFAPTLLLAIAAPLAAAPPGTPPETAACLSNRDIRVRVTTAAEGYFARTSQGWWRNTGPTCPAYARRRALLTRSNQDGQCRGDLVVVFDPLSRIEFGGCMLGDWLRVEAPPPKK